MSQVMQSQTISFDISLDLLAALKMGATTLGQQMRLVAALVYFQEKKLSLGKAAELAGLNRLLFMELLGQKGIVIFDYDDTELQHELAGVEVLQNDCE